MTKRIGREGHCYRCIYTWRIRLRGNPSVCPRCKSRLWNVPKVRPVKLGNGLGIEEILGPHRTEILRLARRYGAKRVRVFGSVRRHEAVAGSDVDLLVDWKRGVDLLDTAAFRRGVREIVGRPVDVVEEGLLKWYAEPEILAQAVPL